MFVVKFISSILVSKPVAEWSVEEVYEWAVRLLDEEEAQKLRVQKVDGATLLIWSEKYEEEKIEEKLRSYGIAGGPASKLASAIKALSASPTGTSQTTVSRLLFHYLLFSLLLN